MDQRRRFFCENCGSEVKPTSKVCPHCGAFFTNVRCPRCNYTGKAHEFTRGCPVCGYLGSIEAPRRHEGDGFESTRAKSSRGAKKRERPWWLFPLIMVALVLSFVVLSVIYMNL